MIDPETIEELKSKHGELTLLTAGSGAEVIVRKPSRVEWKRWRQQVADANKRELATETLFKTVCVHPPGPELEKLLDAQPALPEEFSEAVAELAGLTGEAQAKKL